MKKLDGGEAPIRPTEHFPNPVPTYGGDTVLRMPMKTNDDTQFITDMSKRLADVYRSGDGIPDYAARRQHIIAGLKALEAEHA